VVVVTALDTASVQ